MKGKDTEQLEHELRDAAEIEDYLDENRENMRGFTLAEYLAHLLEEKRLSKADVVRQSGLNTVYGYHIFGGQRKKPSRRKVLSIALAMGLTTKETQRLLRYAGAEQLYVRDPWDSVIWYALEHGKTVMETNALLMKLSVAPLLE